MLGRDVLAFFAARGGEDALGQEVGAAQEASRSLVNRQGRLLGKEPLLHSRDLQVMIQIGSHVLELEVLEVASSDDAQSDRPQGVEHELVDEVVLPRQDEGHAGLGVQVELA